MKKRIINYRLKIDNLLANPDKISKEEWKKILQEHLTQIAFFQHERLVHLIVTVTFVSATSNICTYKSRKLSKDRTRRSWGFCPCSHIRSCLESVELHTKTNNAHAWTHGRGVMRHGRRIKAAGCVKKPQPAYAIRTDT